MSAVCAVLEPSARAAAGGSHLLSGRIYKPLHCRFDLSSLRVRAHRLSSGCPDLHASRDARTSGKMSSTRSCSGNIKKKKPSEFNQTATICLNGQEIQFISHFLASCINETYYPITYRNTSRLLRRWCTAPSGAALRLPDTLGQERQEKIRHCTGRIHLRQPPSCFRENGNGLRNRLPEQL